MKRMRLIWCERTNLLFLVNLNEPKSASEILNMDPFSRNESWFTCYTLLSEDFNDNNKTPGEVILDEWMEET